MNINLASKLTDYKIDASGVAEGVFIGDVNEVGTFGDLLGGPTELERDDDYDPTRELQKNLSTMEESILF